MDATPRPLLAAILCAALLPGPAPLLAIPTLFVPDSPGTSLVISESYLLAPFTLYTRLEFESKCESRVHSQPA